MPDFLDAWSGSVERPPRRQRGRPEMMRIDSRDMDKLNQQVACSDLFGGGGRKEGFHALPEVERPPSRASPARSITRASCRLVRYG